MATMEGYQTDAITGINYTNIRSSQSKYNNSKNSKTGKQKDQNIKEMFFEVHDKRIVNCKKKGSLEAQAKKENIKEIFKRLALIVALGTATVGVTQVVGANKIASEMVDDVKRDDIYITLINGRITRASNNRYVEDEASFIKEWVEDLYEKGWNEDQVAVALNEMYGIRDYRIPEIEGHKNSTFLGRFSERNEAFTNGVIHNQKKGVSK